ncbi:MAG: hypothetical protein O3C40_09135 [Planctomycetota bacterium]|nr:hypothetical protein [Planctomycetota bacterium]
MPSERDKTRRRRQFSIREMLLCTLVVALALGWWNDKTRLSKELQEARRSIQRLENYIQMHQDELRNASRVNGVDDGMAADAWQRQQQFNGDVDDPINRLFGR